MTKEIEKGSQHPADRYLAFPTTLRALNLSSLIPPRHLSSWAQLFYNIFFSTLWTICDVTLISFKIFYIILNRKHLELTSLLMDISYLTTEINSVFKRLIVFSNRKQINVLIDLCAAKNWVVPRNERENAQMKASRKFSG